MTQPLRKLRDIPNDRLNKRIDSRIKGQRSLSGIPGGEVAVGGSTQGADDYIEEILLLALGQIDESCADNATTNIDTVTAADYAAIQVSYHALTNNGGTHYSEGGFFVVFTDFAAAAATVVGWVRNSDDNGLCLSAITADVNVGVLRIKVTTRNLGAACDFRGVYLKIAA